VIAAHCDAYCGRTSATMRTARSRSSSGYLLTRPITQIRPRSGVSGHAGTAHAMGASGQTHYWITNVIHEEVRHEVGQLNVSGVDLPERCPAGKVIPDGVDV
jgi:hypothetical protein